MAWVVNMDEQSKDQGTRWAECIRALLDKHGLTIRAAAAKAGRPGMRTYIADWLQGRIPQYRTAVDFLGHFPRDEAIACLEVLDYPPPKEWQPADRVREDVSEYLVRRKGLTSTEVEQMWKDLDGTDDTPPTSSDARSGEHTQD
jgi:hypothetical protein